MRGGGVGKGWMREVGGKGVVVRREGEEREEGGRWRGREGEREAVGAWVGSATLCACCLESPCVSCLHFLCEAHDRYVALFYDHNPFAPNHEHVRVWCWCGFPAHQVVEPSILSGVCVVWPMFPLKLFVGSLKHFRLDIFVNGLIEHLLNTQVFCLTAILSRRGWANFGQRTFFAHNSLASEAHGTFILWRAGCFGGQGASSITAGSTPNVPCETTTCA